MVLTQESKPPLWPVRNRKRRHDRTLHGTTAVVKDTNLLPLVGRGCALVITILIGGTSCEKPVDTPVEGSYQLELMPLGTNDLGTIATALFEEGPSCDDLDSLQLGNTVEATLKKL